MKIPKPILERRRSIRVNESFAFRIGHENFEHEARLINISSSGILCVLNGDLPMMSRVKIALALPGRKSSAPLRVEAVVVRKERLDPQGRFAVALFFQGLSERDGRVLNGFIRSRTQ